MGEIPQTMIAPPFIRGIEQHALAEDPTVEPDLIQFIFCYQHLGKTAFLQVRRFHFAGVF
jgi:hypothetical protein